MTCKHEEFYAKLRELITESKENYGPDEVGYMLISEASLILFSCAHSDTCFEEIKQLIECAVQSAREDVYKWKESREK